MPCEAIHCWSFTTLVGAFLDLALAYLLLCGASLAFFTAKFLSIFGLRLPCSCHGGLFGNPNDGRGRCLQGLLVEGAPARIASIRASEKSRFPFVSSEGHCFDVRFVRDGMNEGSSSGSPSLSSSSIRESERRVLLLEGSVGSAYSVREAGKGVSEEMPENLVFSNCTSVVQRTLPCTRLNGLLNRTQEAEVGDSPLPDKLVNCEQHLLCSYGNEANTIRILEQALKEEQVAHAALYLELEKERSAAATAADEAMAMILRLQKEKAVVEMEARQYQRMIEEKSAYDEEEMDILKEIIIRREREKHVLEKEVDSCRKVLLSHEKNGRLQDYLQEEGIHTELMAYPLFGSSEDPISMLHRLGQSLDEKEMRRRCCTVLLVHHAQAIVN
ncbi:hypothetical protein QJS10_CPA16g00591 [Acorus calamus]|uniref:GTD-binding domain-containing protein n=1 Tax=Acorus calamus TaxID=4465 RepID=A0AAV9D186_ACOCL|nr:hypothetical protein QJS10_CPA16g00591 [Acorus calamus]